MIVVDSSVWIDWFRDLDTAQTERLDRSASSVLIVCDVVWLELMQGAQSQHHANLIAGQLADFRTETALGFDIAGKAAQNFRILRSKGFTIRKTTDLIIGTFCIENGYSLLQRDRDFAPMERHLGLRLE